MRRARILAKKNKKKYPKNKRPGAKRKGVEDFPTEAVFRVDLKTGQMRLTNQRGDELLEDEDVTPEKLAEYGIEDNAKLLAVLSYAKCNTRHGGCVWKIVNNQRVLVW